MEKEQLFSPGYHVMAVATRNSPALQPFSSKPQEFAVHRV